MASWAPQIAEARARLARSQAGEEDEEEEGEKEGASSERSIFLALGPAEATRISPSAAKDAALEQATQPKSDPPAQEPLGSRIEFLSF